MVHYSLISSVEATAATKVKLINNYEDFVKELSEDCRAGRGRSQREAEAKEVIERLSPHMAKKLKDEKKTSISIECASNIELIKASTSEIPHRPFYSMQQLQMNMTPR